MRLVLVLPCLLLAAVAGCVGPSAVDPVPAADAAGAPDAAVPAAAPAPDAEAQAPAAEASDPAAQAPPASPPLATMPLSFDGATQPFVCVPTALPFCGVGLPSETERYVPEFEGAPRSARVVLTWSASTPLTETLVLHVEGIEHCHEECHAMGASPLELALDDIVLEEEWDLTIHAFAPCQVCDGHDEMVDPGQAFTISGELVYAPYDS